jgi:hypothetical protein
LPSTSDPSSDVGPLTSTSISNTHSNTLTVDEFLRRSAPKPAKRYGRRKRRVIQSPFVSQLSDVEQGALDRDASKRARVAIDTEPYTFSSVHSSRFAKSSAYSKPLRKKKRQKSLATRLIHASGLSQGRPIDHPDQSPTLYSRRPLQFVHVNSPSEFTPQTRHWNLVDPRKSSPFVGNANFSSFKSRKQKGASKTDSSKRYPLSKWRTFRNETFHAFPPHRNKIQTMQPGPLERLPLIFVPVEEAEAAYVSRLSITE